MDNGRMMKSYFINLDRSPGRRRFMERQLAGMPFERIPAVEGSKLTLPDVADMERQKDWAFLLTPNAIGCALSHLAAYRRLVESRDEFAIFLEDDVELLDDFAQAATDCAAKMPKDAAALLYFHGGSKRFLKDGALDLACGRSLMRAETEWGAYAAGGYIIHRDTANKLLDFNFPVYTTSDSWGVFQREGIISGLYAVLPPVTAPAAFSSDIGYSVKGRVARAIERLTGDRLKLGRRAATQYEIV